MNTARPYTPETFMHGEPSELFQATQSPRILVTWPHGDETLGPRLGAALYSEHAEWLQHVDYICGNPRAAAQTPAARYTEHGTDLNRSFTPSIDPQSYEQHRAKELLATIDANSYDYVLDMHTTTTGGGRYFIVDERFIDNQRVREIIAASPIERIVVFPEKIARDGLIGNVPNAISIEYHRPIADQIGVEESLLMLQGLITGKSLVSREHRRKELFRVTGLISKQDDPGLEAKNFELCGKGYFPVLFGENSYRDDPTKDYLGFAATTREILHV